jgi:hypothetical protein
MTTGQTTRPALGRPQPTAPSRPGLTRDAGRPVALGIDLWHRSQAHDLSGLAAELAYRFMFAGTDPGGRGRGAREPPRLRT